MGNRVKPFRHETSGAGRRREDHQGARKTKSQQRIKSGDKIDDVPNRILNVTYNAVVEAHRERCSLAATNRTEYEREAEAPQKARMPEDPISHVPNKIEVLLGYFTPRRAQHPELPQYVVQLLRQEPNLPEIAEKDWQIVKGKFERGSIRVDRKHVVCCD